MNVLYMYVQFYNYITIIVRGILVQKIQIEKSDFKLLVPLLHNYSASPGPKAKIHII